MSHDQKPTKMRVVRSASQAESGLRSGAPATVSASDPDARAIAAGVSVTAGASVGFGMFATILFLIGCAAGAATLSYALPF